MARPLDNVGMTSPTASGLSAQERSAADTLAADLQRVFGTRLQSVIAYNIAGGRDDEPLRTLALVERLTFEDLAACTPHADRWHRIGVAVPLLLTGQEFFRSLDVFPLEYGEIIARHVLVWGRNPFIDARIADGDMRRACELQAKSHLIHLRESFLERGTDPREVTRLIAASARQFRVVLTHITQLADGAPFAAYSDEELADVTERNIGVPAALVREVLSAQTGVSTIADPTALLSRYINASARVWDYVDSWRRE
jgi:hypothetical protein